MRTFTLSIVLLFAVSATAGKSQNSPSPPSEFLTQPSNVTVPVGEPVVLKCSLASKAALCRWYYLELGYDFFDKRITPMLVKEFNPKNRQDCSIKIDKVRKIQEGQWLCQALRFHSSSFLISRPATVRVITESESATWEPPKDNPQLTPRNGRREDGISHGKEIGSSDRDIIFDSTDDDIIQDVFVHETAVLKCQVNQPITSCSWTMPNTATLSASQDQEDSEKQSNNREDYIIKGNFTEGNCSLEIYAVGHHDEGNWRCAVSTQNAPKAVQGPLLHLHILDENTASKHTHDGTPLKEESEDSVNYLVISLVAVSGILFVVVLLLLMFLYRRLRGNSDETQRILQKSPRNSLDMQRKMLPATDLTAASVMAVVPRRKLPFEEENFSNYNQYLDMNGSASTAGDGYIMMPGSSLRSSTSSRTTLSTLSTFPIGRSRSASNSTTDSGIFPHLTKIIDNPSYNPDIALHPKGLNRPDSVYSADHLYEEIKEKLPDPSKMAKIIEADSPTYTNIVEDCEGYMIPKKSPSTDQSDKQSEKKNMPVSITKTPLPDPTEATEVKVQNTDISNEHDQSPPPYSRISEYGLTAIVSDLQAPSGPDPGYSRVGNDSENQTDPMERYDTPRPIPSNPMENYDVPRQVPTPVSPIPNISVTDEIPADGLKGIIV